MLLRISTSEVILRSHMGEALDLRLFTEVLVSEVFLLVTFVFVPTLAARAWLFLIATTTIMERRELRARWRQVRSGAR